jgi:hypothetical protein
LSIESKNIETEEGKKKIINTFINAIYAYDDHIKIVFNAGAKEECVSLDEIESSISFSSGSPK